MLIDPSVDRQTRAKQANAAELAPRPGTCRYNNGPRSRRGKESAVSSVPAHLGQHGHDRSDDIITASGRVILGVSRPSRKPDTCHPPVTLCPSPSSVGVMSNHGGWTRWSHPKLEHKARRQGSRASPFREPSAPLTPRADGVSVTTPRLPKWPGPSRVKQLQDCCTPSRRARAERLDFSNDPPPIPPPRTPHSPPYEAAYATWSSPST